jgi:hypothetical protein
MGNDTEYRAATLRICTAIMDSDSTEELPGEVILEPHGLSGIHVPDVRRLAREVVMLYEEREMARLRLASATLLNREASVANRELRRQLATEEREHLSAIDVLSDSIADLIDLASSTMRILNLMASHQPWWRIRLRMRLQALADRIDHGLGGAGDRDSVIDRLRREERVS